jgi:uncharacterized protein (DUF1697 family)
MADPPRRAAEGRTFGWAAFLRGVNVGGRHKVPMRELAAFFAELGAREVRTYIQSGNVVFRAEEAVARELAAGFEPRAEVRFGFPVPVVVRSELELRAVLAGNPFLAAGAEEKALHVLFLASEPDPAAVAGLDPERSAPDAFAVRGREIYLHLPNGVARTRLTNAYFDRALGTTSTGRNWRTVGAVAAMIEG